MSVSVVLVGIGGYGRSYLDQILDDGASHDVVLAGCADPFAVSSKRIEEIQRLGVPVYKNLAEFYNHHSADLAVISSPIHLHKIQTLEALQDGSNVLCEKPVAAIYEDGMEMATAAVKAKRFVTIGFHLSALP